MRIKISDKNNRFYANIFTSLILCIVITIFSLSTILYFNFENIELKQIYSYTMNNLTQTSESASLMAITASTFARQISGDIHISTLLNFSFVDIVDTRTALTQLNNYRATSPFIDSIYVYNSRTKTFYISSDADSYAIQNEDDFYDREAVSIVNNCKKYPTLMPIPRRISILANLRQEQRDCYTFLLYDTLSRSEANNVIMVNISETQLHKNIDGLITNSESNTFIIDKNGVLQSNSWKYPMLSDISNKKYIQTILHSNNTSGYFIDNVDGVKSFITYSLPDYLGWIYVRIVPYSTIISKINKMRLITIIIGGSILIIGLILSYIISRSLYMKIDTILAKLKTLESEKRNSFYTLGQEFVRNILLGWKKYELDKIQDNFKQLGIKVDVKAKSLVILIKIDNFSDFINKYNHEDRNLFKFGIMNIVNEILANSYNSFAVDMGEDRIAVLLNVDESSTDNSTIENQVKKIQLVVKDYLNVSLSVTISSEGETIDCVSLLYTGVLEASFHRLFYGHGCIIYANEIEKLKARQYEYPVQKEKLLLDELMLGRICEAKRLFEEIIEGTAQYSYMSFNLAMSRLTFAINSAISTIQRNNLAAINFNVNAMHIYMNNVETLDEVKKHFFDIFDYLLANLTEKKKAKHDDQVNRVIDIINEQYMDNNLSLDSIADSLGLSSNYIGRIFKQYTLKTILDYIIEVRMDKAREFLLTTELSVGEIAEKCGFTNSPYFYKAFKKINGVTPNEYRKNRKLPL